MCFYTNILKYTTRIPTKLKRYKKKRKKRFTVGPKVPQCNTRKDLLQKPFAPLLSPAHGHDDSRGRAVNMSAHVFINIDHRSPSGIATVFVTDRRAAWSSFLTSTLAAYKTM